MISNVPPPEALAAINSGLTVVTRRAEIYESDAMTLWMPPNGDQRSRLVDGSISVDYNRDERRTLDITLQNSDGMLKPRDGDGFWYNKVIKVYRGVRYPITPVAPFYETTAVWETQMGEFLIDRINDKLKDDRVVVTARDQWKKLINSKLKYSMTFSAGTYIYELIRSLASNAGITKFKIPVTSEVLETGLDIERGTSRGDVIKQAANTHNYDIYFDSEGYLAMEPFPDPATAPPVVTFNTGENGNIIDYEKSINDSRLYNHIIVYGDREAVEGGEILLPYFGESINDNPASPTNVDEIGDRVYTYASSFFTSSEQCQRLANSWLSIHSLETYELNWSSLYYPWLEAGRVVSVLEPDADVDTPTNFLLDTIDYPLGLAPMAATGKRLIMTG